MRKKRSFLILSCFVTLVSITWYSCVKDVAKIAAPLSQAYCDTTDHRYSTVIFPMMQTHCATPGCHDGSGGAPLNLNNYDELKIFYDNGTLQHRVITLKDMPPAAPLPDSLIRKLSCWMDDGAPNN